MNTGRTWWTPATSPHGNARRRRAKLLAEVASDHQLPVDEVEYIDELLAEDRLNELLFRSPAQERAVRRVILDLRWHHRPGGGLASTSSPRIGAMA